MEFMPPCLTCENVLDNDKCRYYNPIPFAIKNREERCKHYTGEDGIDDYTLFTAESKPEKDQAVYDGKEE